MNIDWGDAPAWAAVVIAGIAAVFAGLSWWQARKSAGASEESATAAKRSVDEARRSADASERSATAAETQTALAVEEATRYRVPWWFKHDKKSRYLLVHDSEDETAYEVKLTGDAVRHIDQKETLGPQETMSFMFLPAMGQSRDVTVTWRRPSDPEGEHRTWTGHPS